MIRVQQILDIQSLDADDARRRKLLNILLMGVGGITLLTLIVVGILTLVGASALTNDVILLFGGTISMLVGVAILYAINRFWSGGVAAILFLLLLMGALAFSDTPNEVASGRTLFFFTLPIIMASVLLQPYSAFIAAAVVSIVVTLVGQQVGLPTNVASIAGFFAIALVSWLSSRSLERALVDVRAINRELDQRVADRTRELQEVLVRVQTEATKTQAILESIADGVIVFDPAGVAFVSNPSVARLIEHAPQDINSAGLAALMGDSVAPEDREKVLQLLGTKEATTESLKVQWGKRMLSVSSAPVPEVGTVVVFRDFTAEAEVARMKNTFISMASHELRTPLHAILGYSDMLKVGAMGPLSVEQVNVTERVIANVQRMLGLVNNLLDQAQIEAGRLTVNITPFSIKELVTDVWGTMKVLAELKGLKLTHNIAEDVPEMLTSDLQRLQQVLINLTGNSIKFTEKGSVDIRVYRSDKEHWALEVADTGPGIPKDAQGYVFDPFRQVDDPLTRKHEGSGLGLSIVKQLTNLLGGDISLKSETGKGTQFIAVFPLTPVQAAQEA